jgi:hypothetical protein
MNRGVDCKDTIYEITFPSEAEASLKRLSFVLEGLLPEEYAEVHTSGSVSSMIITVYEDLV